MELIVHKKVIGDKLVAYGSIDHQTFYVQAPTLEELDKKIIEVMAKHSCKK